MKNSDKLCNKFVCFICGNDIFIKTTNDYVKCKNCGHEILNREPQNEYIINDILDINEIKKCDFLDNYKQKILNRSMITNDFLIDIGSSSGKFLFHNKNKFNKYIGIEITKECIEFTRDKLKLNITDNIQNLDNTSISVVVFWHSLEHINAKNINKILTYLKNNSDNFSRIIISVPNSNSLMYKIFKIYYPYYDSTSHYHQFSFKSLNMLMSKFGLYSLNYFFSFPYTIFGYLQGFMNLFNAIYNFMYFYKKRGECFNLSKHKIKILYLYNVVLAGIFIIPSLFLCLYDLIIKKNGGVLTICYRKKGK